MLRGTKVGGDTAQNQMSNGLMEYDASGDVTGDATTGNSYLYDAEGCICAVQYTVSGTTVMTGYVYNAEGQRVSKGSISGWNCDPSSNGFQASTDYYIGPHGEQLTEFAPDGKGGMAAQRTYVYANGELMADIDPDGVHFRLTDWLGTLRATTNYAGERQSTYLSLPFGEQLGATGSTPDPHRFTGKERDSESGNDYFGARYYASTMGRFLSPDWSDDPDLVPYADFEDPQSLNLYAYASNNPLRFLDNEGHYHCDPDTVTWGADGVTVTAGACHFDWGDLADYLNFQIQPYKHAASQAMNLASQAIHQFGNVMTTPGGPSCMGALSTGGAMVGGTVGGGVGLVGIAGGGVGVTVTEPAGFVAGGIGGGVSGVVLGMTVCPGGALSGGGGRASGSSARLTKPQQRQTAKYLGMKEVKGMTSQGQLVFEKDGRYFSFSNTQHASGEVFKELDRNGNRIATTDLNFNRVGP